MNVYIPYTRLPSEYQEVEYIENNGTAYILSGLNIKDGYRNLMKVRFTVAQEETQYPGISGGYIGPDSGLSGGQGRFYLNGLQTNGRLNYGYLDAFGDIGSGLSTGTDYEIDYSWISGNAFVKLNGTTLQSSSSTYSTSKPGIAPVGGGAHMDQSVGNQYRANPGIRIYYSKFYNSAGTLVRDFVPCYRKSDGVIGLYDLVNSVFYTNQGTGTFSKGNDVIMSELKNAYIGEYKEPLEDTYTTNFTSPVTTLQATNKGIIEKLEATFSISSLGSNSLWFGLYNPSSPSSSGVYFGNDGIFYVEVPVGTRIQSFSPFTTTTYKITYTSSSITINVGGTDKVVSLNSSQSAIISNFFNLGTIYIDTRIDGSSYITVSPVTIKIKYKQN